MGIVEPSQDEEPVSAGTEDGNLVITSVAEGLLLTVERDGCWENTDTAERGDLEPGTYVLTSEGLYHAPGNEAVFGG